MHKVHVINLFGGPGSGKSTIAAHLFALMKWENINVELVTEYAKDITWEKRTDVLKDQLYLLAKQHRKQHKLRDQVDYIITDSPLLLTILYRPENYCDDTFEPLVLDLWNMYDNINYFINRIKPYHPVGRSQTESQALELDHQCLELLAKHSQGFTEIDGDKQAAETILDMVKYRKEVRSQLAGDNTPQLYADFIHDHPELATKSISLLENLLALAVPEVSTEEYNKIMNDTHEQN